MLAAHCRQCGSRQRLASYRGPGASVTVWWMGDDNSPTAFALAFEAVSRHVVCQPSAAALDQCLKFRKTGVHLNTCVAHREEYEHCVRSKGHEVLARIMTSAAKHCPAQVAAMESCVREQEGGFESCTEENRLALDCGSKYVLSVVERHHRRNQYEKELK